MSISGNLKTMELAELLQWLSLGRKTGTLYIANGEVEKRIVFERGTIISSAASDPKEYLGHFLVSHGFIDELMLAKAMEMQEVNRMLLGKILVTIGAISEPDLDQMLRLKAEESIYEIFTWEEGRFNFVEDELPDYAMVPQALDVQRLILQGHQRLDEWRRIRKSVPSMEAVPVAVGELAAPEDDPGAQRILDLVNDDRTIHEIALQTHSAEFHVCRVLFDQLQQGRLKIVRPRYVEAAGSTPAGGAATAGAPAGAAPGAPGTATGAAAAAGSEGVDAGALLATAQHYLDQRDFSRALRHLTAARSLEPDNRRIQEAAEQAAERIDAEIYKDGLSLSGVPRLATPLEELDTTAISPQAAFILSRIDGTYDVRTLLKISPIPPLQARVVLWELLQAGHLELD